jgi:hypothetical protein
MSQVFDSSVQFFKLDPAQVSFKRAGIGCVCTRNAGEGMWRPATKC